MIKNTRDYTAAECMVWMYANNSNKIILNLSKNRPQQIVSLVPANQLKFPNGWYYSKATQTINNQFSNITVDLTFK